MYGTVRKSSTFRGVLATATTKKTNTTVGEKVLVEQQRRPYKTRLMAPKGRDQTHGRDLMRPCQFVKQDPCLRTLRVHLEKIVRGSNKKGE